MRKDKPKLSLELVNSPIRLLALALILVESALAGLIFALPIEQRLFAFIFFGCIVSFTLVVLFALERLQHTAIMISGRRILCRQIPTRSDMYLECARLIRTSGQMRDVSWGRDPRGLTATDKRSREKYRKAVEEALDNGKEYFELFSYSDYRKESVKSAAELMASTPNYSCKIVETDLSRLSMMDFMIGDSSRIIFSHVDPQSTSPRFLYVESEELAALFLQLYSECWNAAQPITKELIDKTHANPTA